MYKIIRYSIGLVILTILIAAVPAIAAAAKFETTVRVNDKPLELEFEPPLVKVPGGERILVPFRAISDSLGIDVTWNQAKHQVTAVDRNTNKTVIFTIGEQQALINDQPTKLDAAPQLTKKRTLLPLRFFSETFGADVKWHQASRTATINRTINNGETIEKGNPINLNGFQAKVTATTLNVRSGPSTSDEIIGKLLIEQMVTIIDFENDWLRVQFAGGEGFISGAYVEIYDQQQRRNVLAHPSYQAQEKQATLTWSKLGGTTVKGNLDGSILFLSSTANLLEEISLSSEAVETILYQTTEQGVAIQVILRAGYSAIVHDALSAVTITFFKQSATAKRIVIDAGHGGKDPGASGNGLEEKEVILDVSLRLQKLLENAGFQVLMTRMDDTFLELSERVNLANNYNADVFVSIHANAATSSTANGTETYWNKTYSSQESKRLAEEIQGKLIEKLATHNRGVKEGNFQVIRATKMPSALVELAFLTNQSDAALLATDQFREGAAQAIFEGITSFYAN